MRCVALQHLEHDPAGLLALPLHERGWCLEVCDPRGTASAVEAGSARALDALAGPAVDLLLVLGGTMGAYETDRLPFLSPEIAMIRRRLDADLPVLGVCLGAQLMAAALGARVYPGPGPEIGWLPVIPTAEGETDPVFLRLLRPSPVTLQWHGDTFDHPAGTVALAASAGYAAQAFRHGTRSYALQFHPEVPFADLPVWIESSEPPLTGPPRTPGPAEILAGAGEHDAAYAAQTNAFMHAYLELLERGRGRDGVS
jgi:GMP synthase (glutamine-hydrolysing)